MRPFGPFGIFLLGGEYLLVHWSWESICREALQSLPHVCSGAEGFCSRFSKVRGYRYFGCLKVLLVVEDLVDFFLDGSESFNLLFPFPLVFSAFPLQFIAELGDLFLRQS